ncbi:MAG: hypothetical protein D3906_12850, partial [Candidatus Electrothrix sp. AUS1_2]|nr:hypothetical protein [Candidatus Electrothrix sp. AUS1_2]
RQGGGSGVVLWGYTTDTEGGECVMTWQETGAFIVQRVVALITGLVIIAIIEPIIMPPDMLPPDASLLAQHAQLVSLSVVITEVALVFQYWSKKMRKVGWALLALTFITVTFG